MLGIKGCLDASRNRLRVLPALPALAGILLSATLPVLAQGKTSGKQAAPPAPLKISRANLAKSATFKVTQSFTAAGEKPVIIRASTVEVKGNKARMDFEDPAYGPVRYLANEEGVFYYLPGNQVLVKQTDKGGVEGAMKLAFANVNERLAKAKRVGKATVSGQPTVVYQDQETGARIYLGTNPGFRLPIKIEMKNGGDENIFVISQIRLNVPIDDARFARPKGAKLLDARDNPGIGLPGVP